MNIISNITDVIFKPFSSNRPRDSEINILNNINVTDPLVLLNLFIPLKIYTIIAENTNLYAITNNTPITSTLINRRYWWPTNINEIRILYGIFYYIEIHREPNYYIY